MSMNEMLKELIAVGASITANCQPCLQYHAGKALELGAGPQEIADAVEVGKRVRKGAAGKMDTFASGLSESPAAAPGATSPCCGG